jgi:hypothetical protein
MQINTKVSLKMDLTQRKLTRQEWESIETPVSVDEKKILRMIADGYEDVNIRSNDNISMYSFVKIEMTAENEHFLYQKYFQDPIQKMMTKYGGPLKVQLDTLEGSAIKKLKSGDTIRMQNLETNIKSNMSTIFEFLLIDLCENLLKNIQKKENRYAFYLYTLIQLKKQSIRNINSHVMEFVNKLTEKIEKHTRPSNIIENAYEFIERNDFLLKYEDKTLFPHQKQIFSVFRKTSEEPKPKLVMYSAPTGTGKTMTPIGLSNSYRIIFVCVARHIGLALAKSAISMEKKVAFAFGCETSSDIRLHYFAASDYIKNRKSGGIGKVDNSNGVKVEIMICDIQSYYTAMCYMLAFNKKEDIITYWDEPTITMDYEEHGLHDTIRRNWRENKIPNVVLSCATLPKEDEIASVIQDFREKFDDAEIHTITSYDCKKSIPILNKDSYCVVPHTFYSDYTEMMKCVEFCENNKTLLRYFDLPEIIRFVEYVNDEDMIDDAYSIDEYFSAGITEITMNSLKNYYLVLLRQISKDDWPALYEHIKSEQQPKFKGSQYIQKAKSVETVKPEANVLTRTYSMAVPDSKPMVAPTKQTVSSGILITTADAHTLTDGPTIFLADDVQKIGSFYIQQSNISPVVFQTIMAKILRNNEIAYKIDKLESLIAEQQDKSLSEEKEGASEKKSESENLTKESHGFMAEINKLRKEVRAITLDPTYVPNTKQHQTVWAPRGEIVENAFLPSIDEYTTKTIMGLDIENNLKVLLLLGIGMFLERPNIHYMEVMKQLADTQKLFLIIASSDYIYGTNYQFCHGFIGKDLKNMTQQKTMQAMGRIGRNNIQQTYSIRFRDDDMIKNLFQSQEYNIEAVNMCKLFCSD